MNHLFDTHGTAPNLKTGPAAALQVAHQALLAGMPQGEVELRVITGKVEPGERTPKHSHRFPVIVYVLAGAFSIDLQDGRTLSAKTGEVMIEPPHLAMTGYNPLPAETARLVMFYASEPGTPFADIVS